MHSLTYATATGRKMARDALTLADAMRDARRIANSSRRAVRVWSETGRLIATVRPV